jgi:hypothetical protein
MHPKKEGFGSTQIGVGFEIFLRYFKMVQKEVFPGFGVLMSAG